MYVGLKFVFYLFFANSATHNNEKLTLLHRFYENNHRKIVLIFAIFERILQNKKKSSSDRIREKLIKNKL